MVLRARADFFLFSTPAYLNLCPFAGCSREADPDSSLSGWVKTGTVLAIDDDSKSSHAAVCGLATLYFQPSSRQIPLPFEKGRGQPPPSTLLQASRAAAPSSREFVRPPPSACPSQGRGGKKGAILFSSLTLLSREPSVLLPSHPLDPGYLEVVVI